MYALADALSLGGFEPPLPVLPVMPEVRLRLDRALDRITALSSSLPNRMSLMIDLGQVLPVRAPCSPRSRGQVSSTYPLAPSRARAKRITSHLGNGLGSLPARRSVSALVLANNVQRGG
jgi:hypothetical protein